MSCFHPKLAYKVFSPELNKYRVVFGKIENKANFEPIMVPCGQCDGCRSDRAKQWAIRCQLESVFYPGKCWFITFTYDDEFLPLVECALPVKDDDFVLNGEVDVSFVPTLRKRDFQLFMKRLRDVYGDGIRFFACSEYGETTGRPHYHAVIFNLDLTDLKPFKVLNGNCYYTSEAISKLWKNGHVLIAKYEYATGAYIAKYISKSQFKVDGLAFDDREKPCLMMSRRPGIGKKYFDINKEKVYNIDRVVLPGEHGKGARSIYPPAYYDYLMRKGDNLDIETLFKNKALRCKVAGLSSSSADLMSDKDILERLKDGEIRQKRLKTVRK